jgi:hypothetical protein
VSQWALAEGRHVFPIDDLREHVLDLDCWCEPEIDEYGVVVHNSLDLRELYERGELKPN